MRPIYFLILFFQVAISYCQNELIITSITVDKRIDAKLLTGGKEFENQLNTLYSNPLFDVYASVEMMHHLMTDSLKNKFPNKLTKVIFVKKNNCNSALFSKEVPSYFQKDSNTVLIKELYKNIDSAVNLRDISACINGKEYTFTALSLSYKLIPLQASGGFGTATIQAKIDMTFFNAVGEKLISKSEYGNSTLLLNLVRGLPIIEEKEISKICDNATEIAVEKILEKWKKTKLKIAKKL